ncbi:dihydrofolate reductase family protein [Fulvivirgaceae bacterium PWU4]|uniref:Dihydrofolate reductase family protein n=1 Tax=Chryseosolibacter histidini TaxID=2782349 RepID=A0AAP2DIX3_9BACT|nr:dihydrofolate reductase family protein [Chryseosolibacter histidini]MBT1696394.1 dihydrofolate reductase family protein [Chryseosolibacter histidini]
MRKVILAMQMTLDGFVCGPNDEMDWLIGSDEEWAEMSKDLESVDTCLLGSKMYPGYAAYWRSVLTNPNAHPGVKGFRFKVSGFKFKSPDLWLRIQTVCLNALQL